MDTAPSAPEIPTTTLNNGVAMPVIGYGVFRTPPEETERAVREAIEVGYRSIDTAQAYRNEEGVGAAVAACGIPREDLFLTTKIWFSNAGEDTAARSIDASLRRLGADYVDLLLVHQPFGDYYGAYRAMEAALEAGKARAIGVSNFFPDRFVDLAQNVDVAPAVNQMETHVFNQQAASRPWCAKYGTALESWGPLAQGRKGIFTHPVLTAIGEAHGKTAAQVALRYLLQRDVIIIPKSAHRDRMVANLDILDFSLAGEEMDAVAALDEATPLTTNHYDPEFALGLLERYRIPRD
ncbi:aldo/keto reductase [Actinomyces timonensis]|uniref:Aldo/keto reductase n=1 Tax=Actinomyces timonensis TaxID=1288391 RepID=A0AAU8N453_9ACTO